MLNNFKKSQITLFILLGLALFAIASLSIYFSMSTQVVSETQSFRRTPTSIRDYVEICLDEVSTAAILNLGYQGGYIELPLSMRANRDSFLSFDAREFFGIPAWFYRGRFRIPSLSDMEHEISYITSRDLGLCLDEFTGFVEAYEIIEKSPLRVTTTISDDSVFIEADYDIDVISRSSGQSQSFDMFTQRHDVQLGKMHELGRRIVYSEAENTNFERAVFDLMAANPEIPLTHMDFAVRPTTWYVEDIVNEIEQMAFSNLPLIRFKGTNYPPFEEAESVYEQFRGFNALDLREGRVPQGSPVDSYEYFNFFFDPSQVPADYDARPISFTDLNANVLYHPGRSLNVVVRPSTAGVMRTNRADFANTPIPFPIQVGHFSYDVSLMVEINLFDDSAFGGDGYMFRFALPVDIRSNQPDKSTQGFVLSPAPVQFDNACDDISGDYEIRVRGLEGGIEHDLNNVEVSYDCVSFGCSLGRTRAERGTYMLSTGLPSSCSGGFINVEKNGYLPARAQHLGEEEIILNMKRVEEFDVIINVRNKNDLSFSQPLSERQTAIVTITPKEHGDEQFLVFGDDVEVDNEPLTLLADNGVYMVDVILLEDVDDETEWIIGGYQGIFEYDFTDTFMRNTLEINIVEVPVSIPFTPERQYEVIQYLEAGSYVEEVRPRFV